MDLKKSLRKQTEHNFETKDGGFIPQTFKLPSETEMWQPKKGKNKIDILPFIGADGEAAYTLEFYIHRNVGTENTSVICPAKMWKKKCPICEEREKMKSGGAEYDDYKELNPKRRVMYNLIDLNDKAKGVQIWEVSHFLFEKLLLEDAKDDNGELIIFAALDEDGRTVSFKARESQYAGKSVLNKYDSFVFLEREKPYKDSMLKRTFNLEELLIHKPYAELEVEFLGYGEEEEIDEPEEEDDVPFKGGGNEPEEVEEEEEEEEEPTHRKKKSATGKKSASATKTNPCPSGHKFGEEIDEHEECEDCPKWDACNAAS